MTDLMLHGCYLVECLRNRMATATKQLPDEWQDFAVEFTNDLTEALGDITRAQASAPECPQCAECSPYLKEDEAPLERIKRERKDCDGCLELLRKERLKNEDWVARSNAKAGEVELAAEYTRGRCDGWEAREPTVSPLSGKYGDVLAPFVAMMERELHVNAGKGDRPGWLQMTPAIGMLEIYYHASKLQKAVKDGNADGIREYAADVANMSMMLVDVCGALSTQRGDGSEMGVGNG